MPERRIGGPSGATLSAADLDELAAIVRDTDIVVLSDEVYEHIKSR